MTWELLQISTNIEAKEEIQKLRYKNYQLRTEQNQRNWTAVPKNKDMEESKQVDGPSNAQTRYLTTNTSEDEEDDKHE